MQKLSNGKFISMTSCSSDAYYAFTFLCSLYCIPSTEPGLMAQTQSIYHCSDIFWFMIEIRISYYSHSSVTFTPVVSFSTRCGKWKGRCSSRLSFILGCNYKMIIIKPTCAFGMHTDTVMSPALAGFLTQTILLLLLIMNQLIVDTTFLLSTHLGLNISIYPRLFRSVTRHDCCCSGVSGDRLYILGLSWKYICVITLL